MRFDAVVFDLYGTLIDIQTDERRGSLWARLARFLRYQGLAAEPAPLREAFFAAMRRSQAASPQAYPEIDIPAILGAQMRELGYAGGDEFVVRVAQLFRSLSVRRFGLFPDALGCLAALRGRAALGLVSDAQRAFLEPELAMLGLAPHFGALVVSSDHGYRKPDPRLFASVLGQLGVAAEQAVYVGDNPLRDVGGARMAGMATVLLRRPGALVAEPGEHAPDLTIGSLDELLRWLGSGADGHHGGTEARR